MSDKQKTIPDIIAEMRDLAANRDWHNHTGQSNRERVSYLADRFEAAHRREAASIERIIRDAIVGYRELLAIAPNDEAETELQERMATANKWLVSHGYAEEKVKFPQSLEEACVL